MSQSLADLDDAGLLRFAQVFSGQLDAQIANVEWQVKVGMATPADLTAARRARYLFRMTTPSDLRTTDQTDHEGASDV